MKTLNEIINSGISEAIEYSKGNLPEAITHKLSIKEIKTFTPSEIKEIRIKANMTQSIFASCIGVTKKAVEAWEGGRSTPDGAARRTLGLMQENPKFAFDLKILSI